jgi:CRISPR/Cas system-associated endoribonuclease Cas2
MSGDNRNKILWQLINKGTCTSWNKNNNIKIKIGSKITTDTQQIADKFNAFFYTIRDLEYKNNPIKTKEILHDHKTYIQNSMFVSPVTENEVKCVINRFRGSLSAEFHDVPEVIVKHCI